MPSNLPPGVTSRMIDPPEQPCDVCGYFPDKCICPECPECGEQGNPRCYGVGLDINLDEMKHGMVRTRDQLIGAQERLISDLDNMVDEHRRHLAWLRAQPSTMTEKDIE